MGRGGFEPPKAKPAGLQPAPVDHFGTDPNCDNSIIPNVIHVNNQKAPFGAF